MKWSRPSEASVKTRHFFQLIRSSKLKDIDKKAIFSTFASPPLVISWVWLSGVDEMVWNGTHIMEASWTTQMPVPWFLCPRECLFKGFPWIVQILIELRMVSSPSSLGEVMFLRNCGVLQCCSFWWVEIYRKTRGFVGVDAIDMHLGK